MNRYDIIQGLEPLPPPPEIPPAPPLNYHYESKELGLAVSHEGMGEIPVPILHMFERLTHELVKKANEMGREKWEFDSLRMQAGEVLDRLDVRCIFKKAKHNALSSATSLGPVEQRAGNYNPNLYRSLEDLWSPEPATPASDRDRT